MASLSRNPFQLDSGVLQQYGSPATPGVTSDPFGSAVKGFVLGQEIAHKQREQKRRDLEERRIVDRDAQIKRREEAAAERDAERVEIERKKADDVIKTNADTRALRKFQLKIAREGQNTIQAQERSQDVIKEITLEVDAMEDAADISAAERERRIYKKMRIRASEITASDLLTKGAAVKEGDTTSDRATALRQGLHDAATFAVAGNEPAAVDALNDTLMPGEPPYERVEYLPKDDTEQGRMGYMRFTRAGMEPSTRSMVEVSMGNEAFQKDLQQATNAYKNAETTRRQAREFEYKAAATRFEADLKAAIAASGTQLDDPTEDEVASTLRWMETYRPSVLAPYTAEQQLAIATSLKKAANWKIAIAPGEVTEAAAMRSAVTEFQNTQDEALGAEVPTDERGFFSWLKPDPKVAESGTSGGFPSIGAGALDAYSAGKSTAKTAGDVRGIATEIDKKINTPTKKFRTPDGVKEGKSEDGGETYILDDGTVLNSKGMVIGTN